MTKLQKFLGATLALATMMVPSLALAGGSSMFWEVQGRQFNVQPGQVVRGSLPLRVETYFANPHIDEVSLDNIEVQCTGDDIVSRVDLRHGNSVIDTANFYRRSGKTSVAAFHDIDFRINNRSRQDFYLDLTLRNQVGQGDTAQCRVTNVTFKDSDTDTELYSGTFSEGYVAVGKNASTTLRVRTSPEYRYYMLPHSGTPTYYVPSPTYYSPTYYAPTPTPTTPTYRIAPPVTPTTPTYHVPYSAPTTPTYRVLPSTPTYPTYSRPVTPVTPPSTPTYKILP